MRTQRSGRLEPVHNHNVSWSETMLGIAILLAFLSLWWLPF